MKTASQCLFVVCSIVVISLGLETQADTLADARRQQPSHLDDVEYQGATISAGAPRRSGVERIKISIEHDDGPNPGDDDEQADYVIDVAIDASDTAYSKSDKILAALQRAIDPDEDASTHDGGLGEKATVTEINPNTVFIDPQIVHRGKGVRSIDMTNKTGEKHRVATVSLIQQAECFDRHVSAGRIDLFRASLAADSVWHHLTDAEIASNSQVGIVHIESAPSGVSMSSEPAFVSVETENGEVTVLTSNAQSIEELTVELRRRLSDQGDAVRAVAQGLIVVFFGAGDDTWIGNDVSDDAVSVVIGVHTQL